MTTIEGWTLESVNPEEITAIDLAQEAKKIEQEGGEAVCYRLWNGETAEVAWLLYSAVDRRGGIAWGADAQWTDCTGPEDAVSRWANDAMVN